MSNELDNLIVRRIVTLVRLKMPASQVAVLAQCAARTVSRYKSWAQTRGFLTDPPPTEQAIDTALAELRAQRPKRQYKPSPHARLITHACAHTAKRYLRGGNRLVQLLRHSTALCPRCRELEWAREDGLELLRQAGEDAADEPQSDESQVDNGGAVSLASRLDSR